MTTRWREESGDQFAEHDFNRISAFVHGRTGIWVQPSKKTHLEGRLRRRLRALGFSTLNQYCRWLFDEGGMTEEESELFDAVTTNKTDFFREPHHFQFLTTTALPTLLAKGRRLPVRIWSAGCSNGAEPYTVAMVCEEFALANPGFEYQIIASDICTRMLGEAARAIYPHAAIEPIPMELRHRYLLRDKERDEVRIIPQLRRKIRFVHHNLMEIPYPPHQPVDLLFCRNLLIYFDKITQADVLSRLCHSVRFGGYLILGHSESVTGLELPLHPVAPTTFLRLNES